MNTNRSTNMLYFYNKAKTFFSELDLTKITEFIQLLNGALPNTKILVIHNAADELTIYDVSSTKHLQLTELVDALPLLFGNYSYTKIAPSDVNIISNKVNLSEDKYIDGACFAIEIDNKSLWFVFLKAEQNLEESEETIISDIALFLEDLVNFSMYVAQGQALAEKLRDQHKKQSIWLESLAWLNELGNQVYSDSELDELYKSALFQLKMLVRADYAIAFLVGENKSFTTIINYGDVDLSETVKEILSKSESSQFKSQESLCLMGSDNVKLDSAGIHSLIIYPLFVQKKLKLVLTVCRSNYGFDDHENIIARLFAEGLEHIVERMYFLRALRVQNTSLQKEKSEQQVLISKLREAQEQLLQNEKMASIGQLAAGVAHEINNPVGYVNSNINSLDGYITDIYDVLDIYQALEETLPADNTHREQLKELKNDIDFDFIRDDIKELISESKEGVLRVKQIVKDLKDFSHVDEAEWQVTDLEKGIDSTLNIVHNELKYKAKINKDYENIPKVECVPSQINQIMMNLMVNAGHAIDEQGSVTIKTRKLDEDTVYVEVIDTGKGIPEENLTKIFDPFFTTKPVGQGTGLGLSLSYSIAEKHGGELSVRSKLGEGTTFRLTLPIKKHEVPEQSEESEEPGD